jgi:hypothetical protein
MGSGVTMLKYDFSVLTRDGQKIESILISARDQADAERKLRQMYRHCEVMRCDVKQEGVKYSQATSIEDILSLISK